MTETTDHPDTAQAAAESHEQKSAQPAASTQPEPPDFHPELGEPAVYRDANGTLHAALITRVMDEHTVHLVVFPDQGHHFHADAKAIEPVEGDEHVEGAPPGWFPVDA